MFDLPTCVGWEHYNDLEYEAFLVDSETVPLCPISGNNTYELSNLSHGHYEFILNATNSCGEQCTLGREIFDVPGMLMFCST